MDAESTAQDEGDIQLTSPSEWDSATWAGLRAIVREDMDTYGKSLLHPAEQMLLVYRFGVWAHDPARSRTVHKLCGVLYKVANAMYVRNMLGFEVSHQTKIGRRVRFVHQGGVVLQPDAEIGDDSMIYHGVTVGRRWEEFHSIEYLAPPRIGRGVHVGAGAVIIGSVRIGDGAKIGPNAVVTKNVPTGASVVAPASRTLRLR